MPAPRRSTKPLGARLPLALLAEWRAFVAASGERAQDLVTALVRFGLARREDVLAEARRARDEEKIEAADD